MSHVSVEYAVTSELHGPMVACYNTSGQNSDENVASGIVLCENMSVNDHKM